MDEIGINILPSTQSIPPPPKRDVPESPSNLIQRQISGDKVKVTERDIDLFLALKPNGEFRAILEAALARGVFDLDTTLLSLIKSFKGRENIYPIAITLRLGANPNTYIVDKDTNIAGVMHILAYVHVIGRRHKIDNEPFFTTVVLLLLHYGSSPMRSIFDKNGGAVTTDHSMNVMDWLRLNDYSNILDRTFPQYRDVLDDRSKNVIGILTGDRTLISSPLSEQDIEKIIMARNTKKGMEENKRESRYSEPGFYGHFNLLQKCPDPKLKDSPASLDWLVLVWSLENYDEDSMSYYTSMGYILSYIGMTKLLISMRRHSKNGDIYLVSILSRMIELNVGSGYIMDSEQYNYLSNISPTIAGRVKSIYSQPYWTKVCSFVPSQTLSLSDSVPPKLKSMVTTLGVENPTNHQNVCLQLRRLQESNKDDLKSAAKNRQLSRLGAKHGYISDFTSGPSPPVLYCVNRSNRGGGDDDYSNYSDMALSSYRDSNGDVWCFLSSNYQSMLETGKNPISGVDLPESYLDEIRVKLSMLKELGTNEKKPPSLSDTIDRLTQNDEIDNSVSDMMVAKMYKYTSGSINQEKISSLSSAQIERILDNIGYHIDTAELSRSMSLYILAYLVNHYASHSPSTLSTLISNISRI